jgi:cytochrome b6-f complex iron-sulfur subunit
MASRSDGGRAGTPAPRSCSRRALLAGLAACAACRPGAESDTSALPDVEDLPPVGDPGWWLASFADHPQLADVGGSAEVHVTEALLHAIVVRTARSEAIAVWSICSHGACVIAWEGSTGELLCPCHGSRFGLDGAVLGGPAPEALDAFATAITEEGVWIWRP